MRVVVKLFAGAREAVGDSEISTEIPDNSSIRVLRESLLKRYPTLQPLLPHAMFALNAEYAGDDASIPEGAEIACIPPVSGG
ncbi:MAG: MoaD/ThiS family protein [Pirellulales bacterium]|nr:MoaD/ThiS family protein [Pirellulales bacterium]